MWCPQAAEWGNASEVFSAVGTVAAVVLALGLAITDHCRRADDRKAELKRNLEIESEFLASYERLGEKMLEFAKSLSISAILKANAGGEMDKEDALPYLRVMRASAERYLLMPSIPIAAYNRFQSFVLYVDSVIAALDKADAKAAQIVIGSMVNSINERWGASKESDGSKSERGQPKAS